jgi:asparagine N-glycosylation enzyme membrane subunit Stt3
MNVLFVINGLTLSIGVLYISKKLKKTKITLLATAFILILALGNIASGFIPADINLFWHSIIAQLGMVTVLAGLWMYASSLKSGKYWTYGCLVSLLVILILIMFVFFAPMPTGLLQRLFYLVIFIWGTVLSFILSK